MYITLGVFLGRQDCSSPWSTASEAAAVTILIDPEIIRQVRPAPDLDRIEAIDLTSQFPGHVKSTLNKELHIT